MGLSLGHIILLLLVGIIVVGPKNLPGLMRTAGQWVAKLRRMSMDLRSQSGIDDLLRQEGLDQHIHELRSLSRFNVVETLMTPAAAAPLVRPDEADAAPKPAEPSPRPFAWTPQEPLRGREYPVVGCDSYGAVPDDIPVPATAASEDPYAPGDSAAQTPKPPAQPFTMGETPKPPAQPVTMGETPKPPAQPAPEAVPPAEPAGTPASPSKPEAS